MLSVPRLVCASSPEEASQAGYLSGCSAEVEWDGVAWREPLGREHVPYMPSTGAVQACRLAIIRRDSIDIDVNGVWGKGFEAGGCLMYCNERGDCSSSTKTNLPCEVLPGQKGGDMSTWAPHDPWLIRLGWWQCEGSLLWIHELNRVACEPSGTRHGCMAAWLQCLGIAKGSYAYCTVSVMVDMCLWDDVYS